MTTLITQAFEDSRVLILDGAMGTELQRRGIKTKLPLWSATALMTNLDLVRAIHLEYLEAGANIITTNTFRTGSRAIRRAKCSQSSGELTQIACKCAHEARQTHSAAANNIEKVRLIAGSVAPLEDCYQPELTPTDTELRTEHAALVEALAIGGVDFILAETMPTIRETLAVVNAAKAAQMPFAVSFIVDASNNHLLSGESLQTAVSLIEPAGPLFISINCIPAERASSALNQLASITTRPRGVYANGFGSPGGPLGWDFGNDKQESAAYRDYCKSWLDQKTKVIGGCCGTTPEYIAALSRLL